LKGKAVLSKEPVESESLTNSNEEGSTGRGIPIR